MIAANASQAFANAAAAMVGPHDVVGTLASLLADCRSLTGATALGVLVRTARGQLELLAATSHAATELELFQIQRSTGPCVDTMDTGQALYVSTTQEMIRRWGEVGHAIATAGYTQVNTSPMRWQGETIGTLNAFHRDNDALDDPDLALTQAFADMATVVIVQNTDLSGPKLVARISRALESRIVIEQAKGILAERYDLDMAEAYQMLIEWTPARPGDTLTAIATQILRRAEQGRL